MTTDDIHWWRTGIPESSCKVLVVGEHERQRQALTDLMTAAGHEVTQAHPSGLIVSPGFRVLAVRGDVAPLVVAQIVRDFLRHVPPTAQIASRFRAGSGQMIWWND